MIRRFGSVSIPNHDVCIVGAGPIGIAVSLALADAGWRILLLDAGGDEEQAPGDEGHLYDPARHAEPAVCMRRGLGGTSRWWGGRLVSFDPIDFETRDYLPDALWPLTHAELEQYANRAAAYFGISPMAPVPATSWLGSAEVQFCQVEAWAPEKDMAVRHRSRLDGDAAITVLTHAPVSQIDLDHAGRSVVSIVIGGSTPARIAIGGALVLACGGIGTTRLLLNIQRQHSTFAGGKLGALGHYYNGHLSGRIADIVLCNPSAAADYDFFREKQHFIRRRFTFSAAAQRRERLVNVSMWADNPRFADPAHGIGLVSAVWAALAVAPIGRRLVSEGVRVAHVGERPFRVGAHLRNVLRSPLATLRDLGRIFWARVVSNPGKPGFLMRSPAGRYSLHFHAEQRPDRDSTISLIESRDCSGLPSVNIELRYDRADAEAIVRAHDLLDCALRADGIGSLDYYHPFEDRVKAIMHQAKDGFHQIGSARMGDDPRTSVADANALVRGTDNLFLATTALLPTSGQANPTFVATILGLRLADHLTYTGMASFGSATDA